MNAGTHALTRDAAKPAYTLSYVWQGAPRCPLPVYGYGDMMFN